MPRLPELPLPAAILLRAVLYTLAILALVIFAPLDEHTFVYLGF